MDHNTRITKALDDLESQQPPRYAETARKWKVDKSTLWRRYKGETGTIQEAISYTRRKLTNAQEEVLVTHIQRLTERGLPPTPQILKNIAEEIAKTKLGVHWVTRFYQRHRDRLTSLYLRVIDLKRKVADNSQYFQHFFDLLHEKTEQYDITPSNIYNFDEKGFLIGLSRSVRRIVACEALESGCLLGASQDGSREFITLSASICADGTRLPPALIYQSESGDLPDSWLEDFDSEKQSAYFASSEKGWSNVVLGLQWLEHVFDQNTRRKAARNQRLLILDGHSSHVNLRFIDYADRNRILLAIVPPHSTHRLQPLDTGMFSPLATYYSQEVDRFLSSSGGLTCITKRHFWNFFYKAWKHSFTERNIKSAWEATGTHPFNPERVMATIMQINTTPEPQQVRTPTSARSLRRMFNQMQKDGYVTADAQPLLHASKKLATKVEIQQHEIQGLKRALVQEKKKRKRGKKLGLYEEGENPGQARFFSPSRVERARQHIASEAEAKRQCKQATQDRKVQAARARVERAREREGRKAARIVVREVVKVEQARKKVARATKKVAQQTNKLAQSTKQPIATTIEEGEMIVVRAAKVGAAKPKKRGLEEKDGEVARKRLCAQSSIPYTPQGACDSGVIPGTLASELQRDITSREGTSSPASHQRDAGWVPVSQRLRSGRNTQPPSRYL